MTQSLRTVFMGTPEIAVPALRTLSRLTSVRYVVTQPDRPAGRGQHLQQSPIKRLASELRLPLWQPESLRDAHDDPRLACDLIVVMAYGELLRQPLLDRPQHGCVNLHASLLPRWRGASPLHAALRAGDERSGVTVMRMVRALDAGPIYLSEEIDGISGLTLPELHERMAVAAAHALERWLGSWPPSPPTAQDERLVTICRKLTTADGHLDFTHSGGELCRWVRAYTPVPGCWVEVAGQRLRILRLAPAQGAALKPGMVAVVEGALLVGCADGVLTVEQMQPAGKRVMDASDYLNGHPAPTRFS